MGCGGSTKADEPKKQKKSEPKEEKTQVSRVNKNDVAELDLIGQINKVKNYRKRYEVTTEKFRKEAINFKNSKKKDQAVLSLKLMKLAKQQTEKADGMRIMLEESLRQLHENILMKDVKDVLEQGNAAIKQLQLTVNIESFEQIRDDIKEQQEQYNQIAELAGEVAHQDEEQFLEELENLKPPDEEKAPEIITIPSPPKVPLGVKNPGKPKQVEQKKEIEPVLA